MAVSNALQWDGVAAGDSHTCGTGTDRSLWCWGYNEYGQLGDGSTVNQPVPVKVGTDKNWLQITSGDHHTCALRSLSGTTAWCWGDNASGQLGDGTTMDSSLPVRVGTRMTWSVIAAGRNHTCGILWISEEARSGLFCWGYNVGGQVGDGTTLKRLSPVAVSVPPL